MRMCSATGCTKQCPRMLRTGLKKGGGKGLRFQAARRGQDAPAGPGQATGSACNMREMNSNHKTQINRAQLAIVLFADWLSSTG